jgi:hypothetical protein
MEEGKKELKYKKSVNPLKLMDEIYAEMPELTPIFNDDGVEVHLRVFTEEDNLTLWVDEETDSSIIDNIVENHKAGEIDGISSDTE